MLFSPTVIPPHTTFDGTVETVADLTVEGRVQGSVRAGGTVRIAANATCVASVEARAAEIHGEVIGDVVCTESIHVAPGGRVVGDLRAPEVAVDDGAVVEGRVDLLPPGPREATVRRLPLSTRGPAPRRPARPSELLRVSGHGTSPGSDFEEQPTGGYGGSSKTPVTIEAWPSNVRRPIPRPPRPSGRVRVASRGKGPRRTE